MYMPVEVCAGKSRWELLRLERERRLFHPSAVWPGEEGGNGTAGHDDAVEVTLWGLRAVAATDRGIRRLASHGAVVQVVVV